MIEIWRDIDGYDGKYQVSNLGRVRSFWRGEPRIMEPHNTGNGYLQAHLFHDGKRKHALIHRLVALAFIPNPESKPQINHINGIKTDNRVENLEWSTSFENQRHAVATGLRRQGEGSYRAKLTNEQAVYIRENPHGLTGRELARQFGVTPATISDIQRGKKYRNADGIIRATKLPDPKRIPDNVREQIRREYIPNVCGHSSHTLARKYGVSQKTIWRIIREGNN